MDLVQTKNIEIPLDQTKGTITTQNPNDKAITSVIILAFKLWSGHSYISHCISGNSVVK